MAVLVAIALSGVGAIVYAIQANQLEASVVSGIEADLDAFSSFSRSQPGSVGLSGTLRGFLASHVPDDCAVQLSISDGRPQKYVAGAAITKPEADQMLALPEVKRLVAEVARTGRSERIDAGELGPLLIAGQPITVDGQSGALVVISYLQKDGADLSGTMRTYLLVALLSLVLITGLAAWQSGRLLAPLRTLRETADEIRETDLSQRIPVRGNDDITQLTHTLNGMLGRLETAFVDQRQFLDDAGHELKTPLTILRGHLELLETGNAEEVAETRALLLDEVDRMSRLVGELILLAKSRGLAVRDWRLAGAGSGAVVVDEQRVTQAVLQLADNAVKHTREGDSIALGSAYDGHEVRLWVADSGPGVPVADRAHIFERFGRGAETPDDDGFGLGLSIVLAIAEAHGGSIRIGDDPELGGARFELTIPQATQEHPWHAS